MSIPVARWPYALHDTLAQGLTGIVSQLRAAEHEVALDVRDDGTGFDRELPRDGFGLVAMRQRIEGLTGTLQIESEPGGGTGISARVPVEAGA